MTRTSSKVGMYKSKRTKKVLLKICDNDGN